MRLNPEIVCNHLPASFNARMSGPRDMELTLGRPELYEGSDRPFLAGRLYLVQAERLPWRAAAQQGAVIVCLGNSEKIGRYQERCCVITIDEAVDFYAAFNALQKVFDDFDTWEDTLASLIEESASITQMLEASEAIFDNPLYVIDKDFRVIGASSMANQVEGINEFLRSGSSSLKLESFGSFLAEHDLSTHEREPLVLDILDQTTLNLNLFEDDEYQGCLTVQYIARAYRPCDKALVRFLGARIQRAMRELATSESDDRRSLGQALRALVLERPLDSIEREIVANAGSGRRFACMRLKLSNTLGQPPIGYIRNMVESTFPHSIVFEYHRNSVVAFVDVTSLEGDYAQAIEEAVAPFTQDIGMRAGLSDVAEDLMLARLLFLQADTALDTGLLFSPAASFFVFQDYALDEMIVNAMASIPIEMRLPAGLRRLLEHDKESTTSYVETLKAFLECNMSASKTATQLFVHRSTLMERLQRIRRELGIDLDDPDQQLYLRILLKGLELHEKLKEEASA